MAHSSTATVATTADSRPEARRRWARGLLERCTEPPPTYGTAGWLALAEGSAEKVASVVVAAECWAQAGDTLAVDLACELDERRRAEKAADDADYADRAAAHRDRYRTGDVVPFAERRRRQLAATGPRPGDYRGGPVPWQRDGGGP